MKTKDDHNKPRENDENDKALVTKEMTLSNIGNVIVIGDEAATSHMTNNKTGVYDLTPIRGLIQFPPEMDENWVRYGLAKLGQISRTKLAEDAVLCVHNTASALNR